MKIVLFAADADENSVGRVYVLWLLARYLGWEVETIATLGNRVWGPLAETEFGKSILIEPKDKAVEEIVRDADVLVGCKPRPESSGRAIGLARRFGKPVLIDIDDPDLEFQFEFPSLGTRLRRWLRPIRRIGYLRLRRTVHRYPVITSNPVLQNRYGGWIVPHARLDPGTPKPHESKEFISVAFVGTVHRHKGIDDLRAALRLVNAGHESHYVRLVATAPKPVDAEPWEDWVGTTTLQRGLEIVQQSDVVVIPSRGGTWSDAQLPAKLMDALLAGRAVCVTDVGPLPWAVADAGIVVSPRDPQNLAEQIARLASPELRSELSLRARQRGMETFTVESVAPVFAFVIEQTVSDWDQANG